MARLNFRKAGLLSPTTLREEIVRDIDQMEALQGTDGMASANSEFPVVNLDAPEETYFTIGGGVAPMRHIDRASESPIGALGDINESTLTTKYYSRKLAPEKETDAKLNSERQILSLYRWAATQLRTATFLSREKVAWQGDDVNTGLIGTDGQTAHPDIPTDHVLTPGTAFSDWANSLPYQEFAEASYLLNDADQGFFDTGVDTTPRTYISPSVWHDLKMNEDLQSRFSGVEVQGLTGDQVRRLIDSEIPEVRMVRVKIPRTNAAGDFLNDAGDVVEDVNDAAFDNVLEPYDAAADTQRRNIVIGRPGPGSAFIPWFEDNVGDFDEADAPEDAGDVAIDSQRGFGTQTWMTPDPRVTWLKAFQDIGFHLMLNEHWVVIQDI
jgi:hypothetical protein